MLIYKREDIDPAQTHWRIDENGEAVRYDREGNDWNITCLFHSGNPFKPDSAYAEIDEAATVKKAPAPKKKAAPVTAKK
tara:strand:+ start:340 stop:576 length:237 start_codon:yes stop_codon:yes gene_type:complete